MSVTSKTALSVILLEDNRYDAELLQALLHSEGFALSITQCDSEESFLAALSASSPDLIISDFSLPAYDGRRALALARSMTPNTPFIFFSGTIGEESAIEALTDGATDYVLKERPQRLLAAVRRALAETAERNRMKEAEAQILAQAQLLDLATDAIVVRDLDGQIHFVNQGAEQLYGYTRAEVVGRKLYDLIPPSVVKHFEEAKEATLRDGQWRGEMEHYTKAMKPIVVMSRWTLVRNQRHEPDRILTINTDITEKKQLEKQFLRAQRLESIGTLASGIAHDLNNILAPITMATELLRQGQLSSEDAPMLAIIDQSARRGAEIVKQVLTFVRGSEGKRAFFSLAPLVKEIAKIARETFPRNIQTEYHVDSDLWQINGDPGQIHQVLMNLCVNARDAMPDGGTLTLSARNLSGEQVPGILLEVSDTGTGIAPDVLDKMFDPFFTTKEVHKGTGLGLSTVLGIIKSHTGRIDVQSTVGEGTTFRILLPAQTSPAVTPDSKSPEIPRGNFELVLLVDDEPELRRVAAQTLINHGYDVLLAADGSEGVLRFTEQIDQIQLVITDLMMPGVDGASFAKTIRKLKPDAKIIGTTGDPLDQQIPEAKLVLKKPYSTEDLLRAVHDTLHPTLGA